MPIPPEPVVRGARRWLALLPNNGAQRTRSILANSQQYSDLTLTQYEAALSWLTRAGLSELTTSTPNFADEESLFEAILLVGKPLWLENADVLVQSVDEIPDDALSLASALELRDETALEGIRRAWRKVDMAARELVGAAGEEAFVADVEQISLWSDAHGYDVDVRKADSVCHIEVKSTTRANYWRLFLSRHEYETMLRDPHWLLVFVRLDHDMHVVSITSVDSSWVRQATPRDLSLSARWESVRIDVPPVAQVPGAPALHKFLRANTVGHLNPD
jgi:hypothetical protein